MLNTKKMETDIGRSKGRTCDLSLHSRTTFQLSTKTDGNTGLAQQSYLGCCIWQVIPWTLLSHKRQLGKYAAIF